MMQRLSIGSERNSHQTPFLSTSFPSFLFGNNRNEDTHTSLTRILSVGNEAELDARQLHWMLQQVQQILASTPSHNGILTTGRYLNCTALHLAIRNYGSFRPLFVALLDYDQKHGYPMLAKRDDTGEFPIHAACRMGIPCENIQLLLSHIQTMTPNCAQVICSANNRGWTPFDLAWIRHLESSSNEVVSTLQNLNGSCSSEAERRLSQLFVCLLSEMVDHVLASENTHSAMAAVAPLMDVISCLIIGACVDENGDPNDSKQFLVHKAFQIQCSHDSPLLPLPLIQLMLFQYPHQASLADHNGKLPLHYALSIERRKRQHTRGIPKSDWRLYVQEILSKNPSACLVKDSVGRLPIHYSLNNEHNVTCEIESYDLIVRDIVQECPAAVEIEDPLSVLYPFMMAATNSHISLDTVYLMLRFHPQCLPSSIHE